MTDKEKTAADSENSVKRFTQFLSRSSQKFLSSFLDDDIKLQEQRDTITQKINLAVAQGSIVVIQYRTATNSRQRAAFESIVGRIYRHQTNSDSLVIKLQSTNQVRMISAKNIKRITLINSSTPDTLSANP
ncbi:hypothetical protein [Vagococcus acidifermentans]|uniref:YolD-like family protein n=1 Tax=Vagococcus acidifermentans TaxID=564710 RepID=A0A430AUS5_9ENTE|nr:hypothetical protein [Vagococcus acidifermentans]RSU11810.1 hypothetical protein CBF27_07580 [Vagococcus acidifermentans]